VRADILIQTQRLMAQTIMGLAKSIEGAVAFGLTPVPSAKLPSSPKVGMIACINDSTTNTIGDAVAAGGPHTVLAWYNGTTWKTFAT
jgi:hypothetical protein